MFPKNKIFIMSDNKILTYIILWILRIGETMNNVRKILNIDKIHDKGIKGKGVTIAIIDTGINEHRDLSGRIIGFCDFISDKKGFYDDNGHGTHIAGICGGDGNAGYGKYRGICPEANIVSLKVLDSQGKGKEEDVIKASEWILRNRTRYGIDIVNISFGTSVNDNKNAMIKAVEKMWDMGIVVVAAAGNNGPDAGTITSPGISGKIITVGGLDDKRKVIIDGKYVNEYSGVGDWKKGIKKPEIIAPATMIRSCKNNGKGYVTKSGTSMAAPIVSGCIGLMLCKNPSIENVDIKDIFRKTCIDRGLGLDRQGYGLINPYEILRFTKTNL